MLCGMSRLSRRSIVAVMTFFSTAILTAHASPITMAFNPASPFSSLPAMDLSSALPVLAALQIPLVLAWLPLSSSEHVKSFLLSMHFSFGLALAGMLRPSKVISFFYFPLEVLSRTLPAPRAWDPSLAMVALGGLIPNALLWRFFIRKWNKPVTPGSRFQLPTKTFVDAKLVVGAILFGIGWGEFRPWPWSCRVSEIHMTNDTGSTSLSQVYRACVLVRCSFRSERVETCLACCRSPPRSPSEGNS